MCHGSGGRENSVTAPPIALSPKTLVDAPREISMRSISSGASRVQYTHPPNGEFTGMPSHSTSVRLAPDEPRPRSDTPCVVGFAARLDERRKRLKPGPMRSEEHTVELQT